MTLAWSMQIVEYVLDHPLKLTRGIFLFEIEGPSRSGLEVALQRGCAWRHTAISQVWNRSLLVNSKYCISLRSGGNTVVYVLSNVRHETYNKALCTAIYSLAAIVEGKKLLTSVLFPVDFGGISGDSWHVSLLAQICVCLNHINVPAQLIQAI